MPTNLETLASVLKVTTAVSDLRKELEMLANVDPMRTSVYGKTVGELTNFQVFTKTYPILSQVLKALNTSLDTQVNQNLLDELENLIDNLEEVDVFSSVDLEAEATNMHRWIRENISPQAILNLTQEVGMTAGAKIIYRGWYKDMSLDKLIVKKLRINVA